MRKNLFSREHAARRHQRYNSSPVCFMQNAMLGACVGWFWFGARGCAEGVQY